RGPISGHGIFFQGTLARHPDNSRNAEGHTDADAHRTDQEAKLYAPIVATTYFVRTIGSDARDSQGKAANGADSKNREARYRHHFSRPLAIQPHLACR